jgi:ABC-type multidrug transport system fused ATPase/permease subunit
MDVPRRFAGAIVSFLLVSVILLSTSVTLGLVVLIGVPLLMLLSARCSPARRSAAPPAHLMGALSNTASDIVGGLRVLRGIGGEQVFHDRYRRESQDPRGRRPRWPGCSRCSTRCRCSCPASSWSSSSGSGPATPSQADHARRAGRVLRLLGVPDDPAADRHRVRQQADPRRVAARGLHGARARPRPRRPGPPARPPVGSS